MPHPSIQASSSIETPLSSESIRKKLLDVKSWSDFKGFALVPGIQVAKFLTQTEEAVGSRIEVTNVDGSSHLEEIVEWREATPKTFIMNIEIRDFNGPLRKISSGILETWVITEAPSGQGTSVVRSFQFKPLGLGSGFLLKFLIAPMLGIAIKKHLRAMLR